MKDLELLKFAKGLMQKLYLVVVEVYLLEIGCVVERSKNFNRVMSN